jgi:hypothetical protein
MADLTDVVDIITHNAQSKDDPGAINWTTMALTLGFFPAFIAFQQALIEEINFNLPDPESGVVWIHGLGNSTTIQCYAPVTTSQRVLWAWLLFLFLLAAGVIWALIVLWFHAHYYSWHKHAKRRDAHLTRGEKIQRLRLEMEADKRKAKKESARLIVS